MLVNRYFIIMIALFIIKWQKNCFISVCKPFHENITFSLHVKLNYMVVRK